MLTINIHWGKILTPLNFNPLCYSGLNLGNKKQYSERYIMKNHARLMQSMNGNAPKPANKRSKAWKAAHPIHSGIIPVVDYVPPSGSYKPAMRDNSATQARFVRETLQALTA